MLYNPDCFCSLSVDIGIRGRGAKEAEELEGWGREGGRGGSGSHRDPTEEKGEGRVDMAVRMCVRPRKEEEEDAVKKDSREE